MVILRYHTIPILVAAAVLSACTRPVVSPKALAFQERENTVRDWNTVSRAIADKMAERHLLTARLPLTPAEPPVPPGRYYINVLRPGTPFLEEVRTALEDEILSRGSTISKIPSDSMVVNLDVTWVRWSNDGYPHGGWLTLAGLAGGGAYVLNANGPYSPAGIFGMAAGAGLALDAINSLRPNTNTEAIWVASIVQGDSVIMEASAPVYVRAGDLGLYSSTDRNGEMASFQPKPQRSPVQLRYAP